MTCQYGKQRGQISINSGAEIRQQGGERQRFGLIWNLNSANTSITARNLETGVSYYIPTFGVNLQHFFSESGNVSFSWLDHAMMGPMLLNLAGMMESELFSEGMEVSVSINGIDSTFSFAAGANDLVRRNLLLNSRRF